VKKKTMHIDKQDSSVKILLIDDMQPFFIVENMVKDIQRSFPLAHIDAAKGFEGIEDMIIAGQYNVIFLDVLLKNWPPHPIFKTYGGNLIPFITEYSPKTFIISISSDDGWNAGMLKEGAHGFIKKTYINNKDEITEKFTIKQ
jgi:hypothetical protein